MFVAVKITQWIEMEDQAKQRVERAIAERRCVACMQPLKKNEVADRGCHPRCAKATRRAISRGLFTDQQRVLDGKILPGVRVGRPPTNPVSVEAAKNSPNPYLKELEELEAEARS